MLRWIRHRLTPQDPSELLASSGVAEAREAREAIDLTVEGFRQEAAADMRRQAVKQQTIRDEFIIGDLFPSCPIRREHA